MKTLIIDAICGVGFPTLSLALEAESQGLSQYDMSTRSHQWATDKLVAQPLETLQKLYEALREAREEEFVQESVHA